MNTRVMRARPAVARSDDPLVLSAPVPRCSSANDSRGYNGPHRTPRAEEPASATNQSAQDALLGESTNLRLVRLRLFLALVTMFAIPIAIAAPVIYGLASRDRGTSLARADARASWLLALVLGR